jgi:hypothetical protein
MGDARVSLASWLERRGADVVDVAGGVMASLPVSRVLEREWAIDRVSLLVRYVDRRCDDRHLTCELTEFRALEMRDRAEAMLADIRRRRERLAS